jgi:hypothetical protein
VERLYRNSNLKSVSAQKELFLSPITFLPTAYPLGPLCCRSDCRRTRRPASQAPIEIPAPGAGATTTRARSPQALWVDSIPPPPYVRRSGRRATRVFAVPASSSFDPHPPPPLGLPPRKGGHRRSHDDDISLGSFIRQLLIQRVEGPSQDSGPTSGAKVQVRRRRHGRQPGIASRRSAKNPTSRRRNQHISSNHVGGSRRVGLCQSSKAGDRGQTVR